MPPKENGTAEALPRSDQQTRPPGWRSVEVERFGSEAVGSWYGRGRDSCCGS
jgi:hypothetical protein